MKDEGLSWPGWLTCSGWFTWATTVVTHLLQVERGTGKVRRPETDVLPLCHATYPIIASCSIMAGEAGTTTTSHGHR